MWRSAMLELDSVVPMLDVVLSEWSVFGILPSLHDFTNSVVEKECARSRI